MNPLLAMAARAYGVPPPIDTGRAEGDWLLLAAGTGLMLSVLDEEPRFRYALDTDLLSPAEMAALWRWLPAAEAFLGRVCAVGWFSRPSNGQPLADALKSLRRPPLTYFGSCLDPTMYGHTDREETLAGFLARLRAVPREVERST